jgi:hypothetical protein
MKKEQIRNHIDRKIEERLPQVGFDATRQHLLEVSRRFQKNIPDDVDLKDEVLEKITQNKVKYFGFYILWAQKRIIDLYKIEMRDINGFTPSKKFRALMFKERLENQI